MDGMHLRATDALTSLSVTILHVSFFRKIHQKYEVLKRVIISIQCHPQSSLQSMPTLMIAVWGCVSLEGMSTEAVPFPTYRDSTYSETMALGEHTTHTTCAV